MRNKFDTAMKKGHIDIHYRLASTKETGQERLQEQGQASRDSRLSTPPRFLYSNFVLSEDVFQRREGRCRCSYPPPHMLKHFQTHRRSCTY